MNTKILKGCCRARKRLKRAMRRWSAWLAHLASAKAAFAQQERHQRTCDELVRFGFAESRSRYRQMTERARWS